METLEQGVKYVQSKQQRHQNDSYSSVSFDNFEHVTAGFAHRYIQNSSI